MSRRPTGTIVERDGADGRTYRSLRFTAFGERYHRALGPVSRQDAERELRGLLADIERGVWRPPAGAPADRPPTLAEYADAWWGLRYRRWRTRTVDDYRWRLERYLLPALGDRRLDEITFADAERLLGALLASGLAPRSANMVLALAAQIYDSAIETHPDALSRNPFRGRARRARERRPQRAYLDSAEQIAALLDAAAEIDRAAGRRGRRAIRRALVAALIFAGPRINEACQLRWRDVDLASGWLTVGAGKTDAAARRVRLRPIAREQLAQIRPADADPDAFVFATARGGAQNPSNIRNRTLAPAERIASARLAASDRPPLPRVTPHALRRTFASVSYALGESPATVMSEMGHTSPNLALAVYAQAMRRGDQEIAALRALADGQPIAIPAASLAPRA